MALKLGKCRLCLKLGDFYSIFTVDNSVQLAEMVMDCARVKVYEGDGLPDKVCSECIQKLSSAYIFKQQCERSDQELRRNYVPPPGFCITPPPTRQSSDSAFSNHTDLSKPSSSTEHKATPARGRKRSRDDRASQPGERAAPAPRARPARALDKRPRLESTSSTRDSDYEDRSASHFSPEPESDSDSPLLKNEFTCEICSKSFQSKASLNSHKQWHTRKTPSYLTPNKSLGEDNVVDIPKNNVADSVDDDDKLACDACGKTFKLKIMLKRHADSCSKQQQQPPADLSPKKELLISLEPIVTPEKDSDKKINCDLCPTKFKNVENLEKHMRVCHAAVLPEKKRESLILKISKSANKKEPVPCLYCGKLFDDYYVHSAHFNTCPQRSDVASLTCRLCKKTFSRKNSYFLHLKNIHLEPRVVSQADDGNQKGESFECRMCNKKMATQEQLIQHLAAHVSNIDDAGSAADEESRASTVDDSASVHSEQSGVANGPLKCKQCDKTFTYRKSLANHEIKHTTGELEIKTEPPDPAPPAYRDTDSEDDDSQEEDLTCDICEKMFSYKRLLIHHKRTKHNMSSGYKRANINLKDCKVKCLICDLEMTVNTYKEHNKDHIAKGVKPRNQYTCLECGDTFKNLQTLGTHIKLVHRLKKQMTSKVVVPDLADFCEVVVTKTEPLDEVQSHNGSSEVPSAKPRVDLTGFTCPICSKKMGTLVALKRHVNWHTNVGNNIEKKVECFVCQETFRFKGHFKLHMREHYKDPHLDPKFLLCAICGRRSKHLRAAQMHMNFHKQTRFQSQDYQCAICKRIFQDRKVYLSHMAIHYKRGDSVSNTVVGDMIPKNKLPVNAEGNTTCPHCGKVCDSEVSLKHHISWHNSKSSLFGARHECSLCGLVFTNKRRMELHLRTHYEDDDGPYKCQVCGKGYNDEEYFRRHVKGHNFDHQSHQKRIAKLRENKVKCPICNRYYPDLVKLIRHLRRTHPQSKMVKEDPDAPSQQAWSCKLCAKVFLDERRLRMHEERHLRKPEFFKCRFCGKKNISQKAHNVHIKAHLVRKHVDAPLQCYKCERTFVRGYDLHWHLRDEHGITETWAAERHQPPLAGPLRPLQCAVCMKVLASQGNFERHLDYHNSLRCNYCFDYFTALRFLEGHLAFSCAKRRLLGDTEPHARKIKCPECYKAFHLQVKLDCHLRAAHGRRVSREPPAPRRDAVCDYCFRVFENEDALASHKVYHRTVGYYGCRYCERKFNTLTLYRKHKNHHFAQLHVDEPVKCEHCDRTFVAFREMIYHMRDDHGDDKDWVVLPKESIEEQCPICSKVFYNLPRHLQYHEENRCRKCREHFYSRLDLDHHLCPVDSDDQPDDRPGDDDRPRYEECSFCFKPITKTNSKLKHDLIHKGSGSISCRFCMLKFKTMDAFNIHAFSHRSRKYKKKPIKCRQCGEQFVTYGPFMKHMVSVHKSKAKMHYRAVVRPERCVVCGQDYPNLHNHYRAHLANQCARCRKYFTSSRLFSQHECDKEDSDPSKVFVCDENLQFLINTHVPKDMQDDEKYYGMDDDEEEEEVETPETKPPVAAVEIHDDDSQNTQLSDNMEHLVPLSIQSPIISDVLSLYQEKQDAAVVVDLSDDDDVNMTAVTHDTVTIDDDD
ncbi:hypothetical protein JYU34_011492 [Plutella xylostella]|uniref:Uncharacterized protein n=1 Tax=Plutella xylostella TaxID=51655 RepID=A0ABQ7QH39_PLUXY|nr:hypothetical protein JYU34_011492 [Plutella xylostella]